MLFEFMNGSLLAVVVLNLAVRWWFMSMIVVAAILNVAMGIACYCYWRALPEYRPA